MLLTFCIGKVSSADDNPFGLPEPLDANRPGSVILHGGGNQGVDDNIKREFVRLAGGKDARILLLPSDMSQRGKDYDGKPVAGGETVAAYRVRLAERKHYGSWATLQQSDQVADFQFLCHEPEGDPDGTRFFNLLDQATGIWLPAYDQEWLPQQFAKNYPKSTSRFQNALRDLVARGGVVGGLGGGMSSLPETVIASNDPESSGWMRAKLCFGLALFNGAVVDQNFSSHTGRLERMTDLLRNGAVLDRLNARPGVERRTIGLGVERNSVLILQRNTVRAMGAGNGHVFLKGNGDRTITWRKLAPGDEPLVIQASSSAVTPSRADSTVTYTEELNPFGLPDPIDAARSGTVILHGGGDTSEMADLLPKLIRSAHPRMVHCPAARESCRPTASVDPKAFAAHVEEIFSMWRTQQKSGRLKELAFITTSDRTDANREAFIQPLTDADALWFSGGDQRPLAELFVDPLQPTRFQQEAINILRRGGVVGGTSAGLAIMADVMIDGGSSTDGLPAEASLSRGLGTLKNVLAEQHFDARSGRIERLTGLLRDHRRLANFAPTCRPKQLIGLAVEEDTALLVSGNRLQVTGKKFAHVFLQTTHPQEIVWHALHPGDAAIVHQTVKGYTLQLEDWSIGE